MSYLSVKEISKLMRSISELTGIPVLWKNPFGFAGGDGLDLDQIIHCNHFCEAIRRFPEIHKKCVLNDGEIIAREASQRKDPFIHSCHAGASELIVPIFEGAQYAGSLFFGPFKIAAHKCPYSQCAEPYDALPVYAEKSANAARVMLSFISAAISEYFRLIRLDDQVKGTTHGKIRQAMLFINTHFNQDIRARDAAQVCGLSVSRFLHLFKAQCSLTFTEYVVKVRMENAKRFLQSSDLKVIHIAFEVGYLNQSYFCSLFRKYTGLSPGKFRRQNRNK